ncbi:MAG: hypothetical protein QXX95_00430 [Nitrososphaerales archaeon]
MEDEIHNLVEKLKSLIKDHEFYRENCLNLIASENIMSKEARKILSSDLVHRYTSRDKFYRGTRFLDEIESFAVEQAKRLFNCKYADVRLLSGHLCNMAMILLFCKEGKILSVSWKNGGYPGISDTGLSSLLKLSNIYFPYDEERMNIKIKESLELIEREKPNLIFFGSSFILFTQPVKEIAPFFNGVKVYDASHVLGLIAGRRFQKPLEEGCNFIIGSTHKSFPGPQGGILLSNDDRFLELEKNIQLKIVDNAHWNRIASLAYSLLEMRYFGEKYAEQIIRNAKALAKGLDELKVRVKAKELGFTNSHQVILDYDSKESVIIADKLERANIIVDSGGRIGVNEITRKGMKEEEMDKISQALASVILKDNYEEAKSIVEKLIKDFNTLHFTFSA